MKSIYNPTEEKVNIQIEGIVYSVEPESSIAIKESHAEKWKAIHGFMRVTDYEVKKEIKEEKKEEVKEEKTKKEVKEVKTPPKK